MEYKQSQAELIKQEIKSRLVKEGIVRKETKVLKQWVEKYLVLTQNYLFTFKNQKYNDPDDVIRIELITVIKSYSPDGEQKYVFGIETEDFRWNFKCHNFADKCNWIVPLERLLQIKRSGESRFNQIKDVQRKGFLSVNEYNRQFPNGANGKHIGEELIKVIQKVYQIGMNAYNQMKQLQNTEQIRNQSVSNSTQHNDLLNILGIGQEKQKSSASQTESFESRSQNKNQVSLLKISGMIGGRPYEQVQQQRKQEIKKQENIKPTIQQEMVVVQGQVYRRVSQITLIPVESSPQQSITFEKSKETQVIPKGMVNSIAKAFQQKIEQVNKEQQVFKQMDDISRRRQSSTFKGVTSTQISNIQKSRVVIEMFDTFQQSAPPKKILIFLNVIIQLMCQPSSQYQKYIKFQCLNHTKRHNFAEAYVQYFSNSSPSINLLKFFHLIYPDCQNHLFSQWQITKLKQIFLNLLKTSSDDQIIKLTIDNLNMIELNPQDIRLLTQIGNREKRELGTRKQSIIQVDTINQIC